MISKPRTLDEYVKLKTVRLRVLRYYRDSNLDPADLYTGYTPRYDEIKRIILNDKALYMQAKQENVTDLPW